jgi:hypothetical protein
MKYSKAHQNFSIRLQKPEALTTPEDFLGPNYETVLNFWTFMESLTKANWEKFTRRYTAIDFAIRDAAAMASIAAAVEATNAARAASRAAWDAAEWGAGFATYELIGMHTLLDAGKDLLFIPLFNDL